MELRFVSQKSKEVSVGIFQNTKWYNCANGGGSCGLEPFGWKKRIEKPICCEIITEQMAIQRIEQSNSRWIFRPSSVQQLILQPSKN